MTQSNQTKILAQLHNSPHQAVLAVTGGGSRAISDLLNVPGASGTLLSAYVPYSTYALQDFLRDWNGEHACEDRTARRMAVEAFDIAHELVEPDTLVHGVACTASLASDREKRGPHRVHVAAQSSQRTASYSLTLTKGARSRSEEEAVAAALVLDAILEAAGIPDELAKPLLLDGETINRTVQAAQPDWPALGSDVAWRAGMPQRCEEPTDPPALIFPGAFNPLHDGHRTMAKAAEELTGETVAFEMSVENVDKSPLDFIEVAQLVAQFGERPCLVTRAPTFVEKSSLFPGSTFVVGIDTLIRIADEDYYNGSEDQRDAAIEEIASAGCRLLAFGRAFDEEFIALDDLALPPALAAICTGVPEEQFRVDLSSTEIRETGTDSE